MDSPVLHSVERLLVGDVIHEQEAHGSSVVGRGNGAISLLTCSVLQTTNIQNTTEDPDVNYTLKKVCHSQ